MVDRFSLAEGQAVRIDGHREGVIIRMSHGNLEMLIVREDADLATVLRLDEVAAVLAPRAAGVASW